MKALVCGRCGDIQALQDEWRSCKCGNVEAHWTNGMLGTAEFRCRDYATAFLLGLNNRVLVPALRGELDRREAWKAAHEEATDAPNHIFDKSRKGCWAVIVRMGATSDVKRAEDDPNIGKREDEAIAERAAELKTRPPQSLTTDPTDPRLGHGSDTAPVDQHEVYLVLSEEERAKGFVRPYRNTYRHVKCEVNPQCVTRMGTALSETYARDPSFYGATYCVACRMHKPVSEFVWDKDGQVVGS